MKKVKKWGLIVFGGLVGLANGLFGGGGGMIVVPFLNKMMGLEQKKAQASALFVILPISIVSAIIYASKRAVDFSTGWPVILGIVGGGVLGALLLKKLNNNLLKLIFIILMLISGVWLLVV